MDGAPAGADAPAARTDARPGALPDLFPLGARAHADLAVSREEFANDACELDPSEACVGGPGLRELLRFSIQTPNIGTADLALGAPSADNENFVYSECHGHYHLLGYAEYQLLDPDGEPVGSGHKQAFCLLDTSRYDFSDPTVSASPRYSCGDQGISRGWSDVYEASLPCQFVDVTGVPAGDYTLAIEINSDAIIDELDRDNNRLSIPVTLGAPELSAPDEACPTEGELSAYAGSHRECGWRRRASLDCPAGRSFILACAAECGADRGSCTGDPMLRVCDPDDSAGNCSATHHLSQNNDACGSLCPRASGQCPGGGVLEIFDAPNRLGEAYECDLQLTLL